MLELDPCGSWSGVFGGKHRACSRFFQISAHRWAVLGGFLDEPCDFSSGKVFFEQQELLEIQATGDDQSSGCRDSVFMEDLSG